ncbi:hypothetical protein K439DRAFT_1662270 [Ramaria rubella]|nr:hypothetical protein K439DRAFT_1662270 [Ramaria rubella]
MPSLEETKIPFDLDKYLSRLTLQPIVPSTEAPAMPPRKMRSTLTPLTLKPGGYRKLRQMHRQDMSKKVEKFLDFSELAAEESAFRDLDHALTCDVGRYAGSAFDPYLIENVTDVVNLLYRFLLRSTKTTLDMLDASMHPWSFQTLHWPRSISQSLKPIVFSLKGGPRETARKSSSVKMVMLPLGPWEFSPQDFIEFSSLGLFDDTESSETRSREWLNADRMWAYLYDLCFDFDCPFFVVTSYDQWIFGVFSKHYTNAWFTPTLHFDNKPISIIEIFTFWIHASFGKPNTLNPPSVYLEKKLTPENLEKEQQAHAKRFREDDEEELEINTVYLPEKRRRLNADDDSSSLRLTVQSRAVVRDRYRRPPKLMKELRAFAEKQRRVEEIKHRADTFIPLAPSHAPSSAEPLPESQVPKTKNAWCERWRDMVAMGEDGTIVHDRSWTDVTLQVCDPVTGSITGEVVAAEDKTCPSCCPPSPTCSECSLTEEELAMYQDPPIPEAFHQFHVYQWI